MPTIITDVRDLGWGSNESQWKRFDALTEILIDKCFGGPILDVGCGYGDFNGCFLEAHYHGIDIDEKCIETARKKYPYREFDVGGMSSIIQQYEYVFASGIFCYEADDWTQSTSYLLNEMMLHSQDGVAVNFLSALTPYPKKPGMKLRWTKSIKILSTCLMIASMLVWRKPIWQSLPSYSKSYHFHLIKSDTTN